MVEEFLSFMVLSNYLIPISLYVTLGECSLVCQWNDLPDSLYLIDSLELFKSYLKTHLFKASFVNYLKGIL